MFRWPPTARPAGMTFTQRPRSACQEGEQKPTSQHGRRPYICLVVDLRLWKIWVCQLGLLFPICICLYIYRKIPNVPNHQPDINTWLWDGHKSLPPSISHYTTIQCPLNPPCFMAKKKYCRIYSIKESHKILPSWLYHVRSPGLFKKTIKFTT